MSLLTLICQNDPKRLTAFFSFRKLTLLFQVLVEGRVKVPKYNSQTLTNFVSRFLVDIKEKEMEGNPQIMKEHVKTIKRSNSAAST